MVYKKPTLAFVDHSFHKKTHSADFLRDFFRDYFDITDYWDERWCGGAAVSSYLLNQHEYVFYFQVINDFSELKKVKSKIIWAPMYDGLPPGNFFWKVVGALGIKLICFSAPVFSKAYENNIPNIRVKYYRESILSEKLLFGGLKKKISIFFWYRGGIRFSDWKKLFNPSDIERVVYLSIPDPNHVKENISKEDIVKYKIDVISTSFLPHEEYLRFISECDIFIAPRKKEGIGMSFLEALAMGKGLVGYNDGTMNEYIKHGVNGYIFDERTFYTINISDIQSILKKSTEDAIEGYRLWEGQKKEMLAFIFSNSRQVASREVVNMYILLNCINRFYYLFISFFKKIRRILIKDDLL